MAVTLGDVSFDPATTTVRETHEEVGGRRERVIEISGVVVAGNSESAIHAALDAILAAASTADYSAALSLRPGRRMFVRRAAFARSVSPDTLTGSFVLKLSARDAFEESTAIHSTAWPVTVSGATLALTTSGNTIAHLSIRLTATGSIVDPSFADGTRMIAYAGTLAAGDVLVFDGELGTALLNGDDVLPYVTGTFPELGPDGAVLTYQDAAPSSHHANVTVEHRDRWW